MLLKKSENLVRSPVIYIIDENLAAREDEHADSDLDSDNKFESEMSRASDSDFRVRDEVTSSSDSECGCFGGG